MNTLCNPSRGPKDALTHAQFIDLAPAAYPERGAAAERLADCVQESVATNYRVLGFGVWGLGLRVPGLWLRGYIGFI